MGIFHFSNVVHLQASRENISTSASLLCALLLLAIIPSRVETGIRSVANAGKLSLMLFD